MRSGRGSGRSAPTAIRNVRHYSALSTAVAGAIFAAFTGTAALAAPASGSAKIDEYRVNAGDELEVFVWGEEKMQRPVRVLPDGTFAFPLAGIVPAEGHTSREIAELIRDRIKDKYRTAVPDVTVAVRDPAGMRFYVVGKVRAPGSFPIGRSVNVVQALSLAGGTAEFADVSDAVILRQTASGQTVDRVNLADILKGGKSLKSGPQVSALPLLRTGDVLVIP
jgi:polysaccharide export outer membrane protein